MGISIVNRPDYKGPLVRVPVPGQPGRFIKMTEEEAIARGLLKKQEPTRNKARRGALNKRLHPGDVETGRE